MSISEQDFKHVAQLAKLSFSDEEVGPMNDRFTEILDMVEKLSEVDTEGVEVMTHGINLKNIMRDDQPEAGTDRDLMLKNAPTKRDGFIVVPASFEESED
ncbi:MULTISPECIES: Asp-tRNA(Asn)/Glu-tRNA(Gln) amidotransferase subunit GatC [Aerococcus]|uniref:Asp-tRNA(Asn)/Glu-tRNA(Gln) amidotransferase subunit GatC n=1 Tax=Aerococcus urinae (strain CCUG 59500 / ACS-120-V-Col10a) TaxID=2976812 RepID=UPI000200F3F1|nr:Asp-tRNA(Asn)/Glu-tRNA(Gln) amidotransferase subunit GatC [Aerococcus sp. Group 1]AEA00229.1 aspartyl/glutamyl-tRNA(Asn/Gln) amidotransferase, C subunit [Aerococcus sp. Group 1]MCY3030314.1 Asp-tRNA(Asn)/Glu-tRNA(Gln) amidotransferase subunit GatC [Aerococcus sp. Group 1]MCY3055000.1 Asp-tRNA(Asn)/Glu-tRNA(Gln) amidotransferase subunit GatC [Aerococcus sp. Group 1]MCY3056730.1 Asp-tRNA(Asn)/Glu-tRNA(Gln) amidotransferase subunit GatC [Aerococcus sp. Group 1]MCY3061503.1 Asp-tRNA(Asn)/Glu-tR